MGENRFKQARQELGWKTNEMAAKMGVSQETVSNWESGKRQMTLEKLSTMSQITGFSISYLLGNETEQISLSAPLSNEHLAVMHACPVWTKEYGWGLVNIVNKCLTMHDGRTISFEQLSNCGIYGMPPVFTLPAFSFEKPLSVNDIMEQEKVWLEPISSEPILNDELRGWYRPRGSKCVENEYGNRFYIDTYGAKWLAFANILD